MKIKKFVLFLIAVSFIFCGLGYVQPCYADRGGERHACQQEVRKDLEKAHKMVQHGIQTRQINQQEAEGIRQNLKRVENDFNRALSDGRLDPRECERLQREIRGLYRHIKHDIRDDDNGRQGHGAQGCQHEVRRDLEKARMIVEDGVNANKISPQELFVINKRMDELENDLRRYSSDGRLNPRECDRLKKKIKDIYDLIGYARNN